MVANPTATVARIAPASLGVKPVPARQVGTNTGTVLPLLVMDAVPLAEAITQLAGAAQLPISFDPAWSGPANKGRVAAARRWEKITARQALAAALDNYESVLVEAPAAASARILAKPRVAIGTARKTEQEQQQP